MGRTCNGGDERMSEAAISEESLRVSSLKRYAKKVEKMAQIERAKIGRGKGYWFWFSFEQELERWAEKLEYPPKVLRPMFFARAAELERALKDKALSSGFRQRRRGQLAAVQNLFHEASDGKGSEN